jgi:hypothetical protein
VRSYYAGSVARPRPRLSEVPRRPWAGSSCLRPSSVPEASGCTGPGRRAETVSPRLRAGQSRLRPFRQRAEDGPGARRFRQSQPRKASAVARRNAPEALRCWVGPAASLGPATDASPQDTLGARPVPGPCPAQEFSQLQAHSSRLIATGQTTTRRTLRPWSGEPSQRSCLGGCGQLRVAPELGRREPPRGSDPKEPPTPGGQKPSNCAPGDARC